MIFVFEDSEIAHIRAEGGALHIRFSAARLVQAEQIAGAMGAGQGQWQPLLWICKQVVLVDQGLEGDLADISSAAGRVQHAQLYIDGQRLRSLPLPFSSDAAFALELELAGGLLLQLKGQGMELQDLPSQGAVGAYQC